MFVVNNGTGKYKSERKVSPHSDFSRAFLSLS
jgi:hypothetical protein